VDSLRDVGEHLGFVRERRLKAWWFLGASFYYTAVNEDLKDIGEYLGFVRREEP
jgi:hypothetical protein